MNGTLGAVFLSGAEAAFIEVTVFVGVVLLLFGYIDYTQQGAVIEKIEKSKQYQPLIGALLGIVPGCGGSILLMPLYVKGSVTFGTVVATLIATAGDSAFVTLTQAPREFIYISVICLVVGTATGYVVDYYQIGDWVRERSTMRKFKNLQREHKKVEALANILYQENPAACRSCDLRHIGHEEGDEIDMILHHTDPSDPTRWGYKIVHNYYNVFWLAIAIGFILGVLELLQVDINRLPGLPHLGTIVGVSGTVIVVIYMICSQRIAQAQSHEDAEHKLHSLAETLAHNAQETAFVGTWVFVAYLVYGLGVYAVGGEEVVLAAMTSAGLGSVLLGVLVGIIPGCGPQVLFVSLYLKGMFPFAALLANAISQDGDALFPLIAMDRNAALWSTVINTIVAAVVGMAAYWIFP
ncbi:MAG: arsenic efflux protein [Firmicutes bacterium]|nr:arsenic efflux protein [Bacillota bacterium]